MTTNPITTPDPDLSDSEIAAFLLDDERRLTTAITGSAALSKACYDNPFDYAMKLRTGEVIAFSGATILNREWVHLEVKPMEDQPHANRIPFPAERGLDVRLSDIVWVMDAPLGS